VSRSSFFEVKSADPRFAPVPPEWMEDGGFQNDVRMTYCASVVMSVIGRYEVELEKAVDLIGRCQVSYAQHAPGGELTIDMGRRILVAPGCY
jgi:hypothetical protein